MCHVNSHVGVCGRLVVQLVWERVSAARRWPGGRKCTPLLDLRMLERADDVQRATCCLARMRGIQKELHALISGVELFGKGQRSKTLATQKGLVDKVRAEAGIAPHYAGSCVVG